MIALLLATAPHAHISMNPNYGAASGGYFMTHMKVPHGHYGMHTVKFVLHVPRGALRSPTLVCNLLRAVNLPTLVRTLLRALNLPTCRVAAGVAGA